MNSLHQVVCLAAFLTAFGVMMPASAQADDDQDTWEQQRQQMEDWNEQSAQRRQQMDDWNAQLEQERQQRDEWNEQWDRERQERDDWNEQVNQQRQQDEEWREQMKAFHQEMEEAGMPQGVAQQQGAPQIAPNPQLARVALQQMAAAQGFGQQVRAMQQAMLRGLGGKPVAPKPAAPPVAKANPAKPAAPAPKPMTAEERATGKFNMAMILAKGGKTDTAEEYFQFIVKTYPGTAGAAQAQAFLNRPMAQ